MRWRGLLLFLCSVSAAVGFIANGAAELAAQLFTAAVEAGVARFAFKAPSIAVPVKRVAEIEAGIARRVVGVQAAACGVVNIEAERFAALAVIEAGADVGIDAVVLAEVADGRATVIGVQLGAVARHERFAHVEIGFRHAAVVADGAKGLV